MLDQAENQLENGGPWRNPEAPAQTDFGTEKDRANCPFFLKTGACRFGDRCSRKHDHPASSSTLLIRGMFVHYGMEQSRRDDYDTDANLEYSEEEVHQQFLDFYEDALPEFKSAGKVIQFKVSCNFEPHLRGNVYVQYATEEDCSKAFLKFNGRWYAGRQLQCEFSPVTRWKTAICGLFDRKKCPKGKHCNFLHVFRNPTREFFKADQDFHLSPDRDGSFTGRFSERSWSQRGHSPDRWSWRRSVRRSRSRERRSRSRERRSRSRERRSRSRSRERRSRSRERQNREQRSRSRSQESKRSRHGWYSKATSQSKRSRRSRSKSRERRRSRSRDRNGDRRSREWSPRTLRSEDKSKSEEPLRKSRKRDKEIKVDLTDPTATTQRHKHSKKSKKKKSKKKHKKKKSKSPGGSSSAESGKESEDDNDDQLPTQQDEGPADQQSVLQNEDSTQCPVTAEREVVSQLPSPQAKADSVREVVITDPENQMIVIPDDVIPKEQCSVDQT